MMNEEGGGSKFLSALIGEVAQLRRMALSNIDFKDEAQAEFYCKLNEVASTYSSMIDKSAKLNFDREVSPTVSIIIAVYGKLNYTLGCLASIAELKTNVEFEILIVDDYSPDESFDVLSSIGGVRVLRNDTNIGFLKSCNKAAKLARGQYLVFLNNDTEVMQGWLDHLVGTFERFPTAGYVGSKLLYPDGYLQEAGGIIWNDASGWNFGRMQDPHQPEYNYVRDVDYCSGASIAVPASVFLELGGFDEIYTPAYFEDADLAFSVKAAGYRVLYQPLSQVIHFEGITCGRDLSSGVKSFQVTNREKFAKKWANTLTQHREHGVDPFIERERDAFGRVLIVDALTPTPDRDAGSVTAFFYQQILVELGYKVTFVSESLARYGKYTQALQQLGVECLYWPYTKSLECYLKENGKFFDVIFLYRAWTAFNNLGLVKNYCPNAKIVFDTVDLHYLREERQADLSGDPIAKLQAKKTKNAEYEVIRNADRTIVLSSEECEIIRAEEPQAEISVIPLILDLPGAKNSFNERDGFVFIGGFDHQPNVDAVEYFVKEIWPLVRAKMPKAQFSIVGSRIPKHIECLGKDDGIHVLGFVEDLEDCFGLSRVNVVPLRFGAGIKGKIGSASSYGVPTVATSIAVEGMGMGYGNEVLVADTAHEFAQKMIELHDNEPLWSALSSETFKFVSERYSKEMGKKRLSMLLQDIFAT